MTAVHVEGLVHDFGPLRALDSVSFTVPTGRITGFLGPNGAGKTTLMRILVGLVRLRRGRVSVLGKPPGSPEVLAKVGAIIESPAFHPRLSGKDNLRYWCRLAGLRPGRVASVLTVAGLGDRANDPVHTYSLGMKQRLGLAAAILGEPELLILDEPQNGLDPAGLVLLRRAISNLANAGITVFLSSHALSEVERLADRLVVLRRGKTVFEGAPEELRARGGSDLLIRPEFAEDLDALFDVCNAIGEVRRDGNTLIVRGRDQHAAKLNRLASDAGITLVELRSRRPDLETLFARLQRAEDV